MKLNSLQEYCTPDPGTIEGPLYCGVCETLMECQRNCYGARSWASSMGGIKSKHDFFWCPYIKEQWHIQILALNRLAHETCSKRLADMFLEEAKEILITKVSTKDTGMWRVADS